MESNSSQTTWDLNKPCKLVDITFEGAKRTRPSVLAKIVSSLFSSRTILDFAQNCAEVREKLDSLGAFSDLRIILDAGPKPDEYKVVFFVEERGRLNVSAQWRANMDESYFDLSLMTPNLNGIGDSLKFTSQLKPDRLKQLGLRGSTGECSYSIPIRPWKYLWNPTYSIHLSNHIHTMLASGFDHQDRSIVQQVDFRTHENIKQTIAIENLWRHIKSNSARTPIEIRELCGHSTKSCLKYKMEFDDRIGGNFPQEGSLARLTNELMTNHTTRHDAELQYNASIFPKYDVLLQLSLLAGTLFGSNRTNICDKFFAGGPTTLRGFRYQGIGPNVRGYPLGDMSYLTAGVHLYSILPYTTKDTNINRFIRPHMFLNTGTIGDINQLLSPTRRLPSIESIRDSFRWTCGFGLVMYFSSYRLEANYCIPLIYQPTDFRVHGFQWGFKIDL